MVYMAGDNNLSEDMITALKGMMGFGESANINLVALYDGCYPFAPIKFYNFTKTALRTSARRGNRDLLDDFQDELEEKTPPSTDAARISATDAEKTPETKSVLNHELLKLEHFVPLVMKKFPAEKYALILSGHSDGVIGRRLLPDGDTDVKLNLISLRKIMERVLGKLEKDKNGKRRKFDIIGFDGCLMGMIEVGFEMRSIAKYMVASQGNIPTSGWVYEDMLAELISKEGKIEPKELVISMVDSYVDYNEDFAIGGRSVNISACDLQTLYGADSIYQQILRLARLFLDILNLPVSLEKAKENSENGNGDSAAKDPELTDEQKRTFAENLVIREKFIDWMILSHYRSQTFMHSQAVDVIDFTYNILLHFRKWQAENEIIGTIRTEGGNKKSTNRTVNKIQDRIEEIFTEFININESIRKENQAYILRSCSIGAEYQFSQGVSLFLPWSRMAYNMLKNRYSQLNFNDDEAWLNFIDKLTALTMRAFHEEPLFNENISSLYDLPFSKISHREVGGREVGGREVGGREVGGREVGGRGISDEFYFYFSQFRNYRPDVFKKVYVDRDSFIKNT